MESSGQPQILAEIENLMINFYTYQGVVKAIDGIDLIIHKNETLGLVGETGCGKSVTASAIMKLILTPPGKIENGAVYFMEPNDVREKRKEYAATAQTWYNESPLQEQKKMTGVYGIRATGFKKRVKALTAKDIDKTVPLKKATTRLIDVYVSNKIKKPSKDDLISIEAYQRSYDLLKRSTEYMQKIRGRYISMIFQEPTSALNPVFPAGDQIAEVILLHRRTELAARLRKSVVTEINAIRTEDGKKSLRRELNNVKKCSNCGSLAHVREAKCPSCGSSQIKILNLTASKTKYYECKICDTIAREEESACRNCGLIFKGHSSLNVKSILHRRYARIFTLVEKNPRAIFLQIRKKIPIMKRFSKDMYSEAMIESVKMLKTVRIPDPEGIAHRFPHELSGGMQQRVMIAIALACNPKLLIADEPTTALDVTIQAQILKLMRDLKSTYGSSILLITHNLGVVAEMCDRVGVMYAGSMVEIGSVHTIFKSPSHPYTVGLMNAVPSIQMDADRLYTIAGSVPNLIRPPSGCRFNPRCPYALTICKAEKPTLTEIEKNHHAACYLLTPEIVVKWCEMQLPKIEDHLSNLEGQKQKLVTIIKNQKEGSPGTTKRAEVRKMENERAQAEAQLKSVEKDIIASQQERNSIKSDFELMRSKQNTTLPSGKFQR